mmetsp:Transcript_105254/g.263580  ORF Transcript_105254/g.263580 Transcript_105254/m.263580 type:complete len:405 (-) Transcript_105254:150-1364(-)
MAYIDGQAEAQGLDADVGGKTEESSAVHEEHEEQEQIDREREKKDEEGEAAAVAEIPSSCTHEPAFSPVELKASGNEAWAAGQAELAVELWNAALRAHVEGMMPGAAPGSVESPLSEASRALERSLYLNLAQGYLRLGEPTRTLRACQVVVREHPEDAKAKYRAAEACLALKRFDEVGKWLDGLLENPDAATGAAAARLLQRAKVGQKCVARRQQEVARRMCTGAAGYSEGRQDVRASTSSSIAEKRNNFAHRFAGLDTASMVLGSNVADEAAMAAQRRQERLSDGATPPEPTAVPDLSEFQARITARTNKYAAHIDKCRRKKESARHSVKLDWLRGGRDGTDFDGFAERWREELQEAQADALAFAAPEATEGEEAAELGGGTGCAEAEGASPAHGAADFDDMD